MKKICLMVLIALLAVGISQDLVSATPETITYQVGDDVYSGANAWPHADFGFTSVETPYYKAVVSHRCGAIISLELPDGTELLNGFSDGGIGWSVESSEYLHYWRPTATENATVSVVESTEDKVVVSAEGGLNGMVGDDVGWYPVPTPSVFTFTNLYTFYEEYIELDMSATCQVENYYMSVFLAMVGIDSLQFSLGTATIHRSPTKISSATISDHTYPTFEIYNTGTSANNILGISPSSIYEGTFVDATVEDGSYGIGLVVNDPTAAFLVEIADGRAFTYGGPLVMRESLVGWPGQTIKTGTVFEGKYTIVPHYGGYLKTAGVASKQLMAAVGTGVSNLEDQVADTEAQLTDIQADLEDVQAELEDVRTKLPIYLIVGIVVGLVVGIVVGKVILARGRK